MALQMDLRVESKEWYRIPELDTICLKALEAGFENRKSDACVDVLLADNSVLESLNKTWRGKDSPTDVLSFPADENSEGFLGDIAIAFGVAARDAEIGDKSLAAHLSHLLVHGLLHLLGHDHVEDNDAILMENLERAALERLGFEDPYSRIAEN